MTVGRLRDEIGAEEFVYWGVYYARKAQAQQIAQKRAKG